MRFVPRLWMQIMFLCISPMNVFAQSAGAGYLTQAMEFEKKGSAAGAGLALPSVWSVVLRMSVAVVIVVALMIACVWFIKKLKGNPAGDQDNFSIRVLAKKYIDTKHAIYIVDILGKIYILGKGDGQLSLISEIEGELKSQSTPEGKKTSASESQVRWQTKIKTLKEALK